MKLKTNFTLYKKDENYGHLFGCKFKNKKDLNQFVWSLFGNKIAGKTVSRLITDKDCVYIGFAEYGEKSYMFNKIFMKQILIHEKGKVYISMN